MRDYPHCHIAGTEGLVMGQPAEFWGEHIESILLLKQLLAVDIAHPVLALLRVRM